MMDKDGTQTIHSTKVQSVLYLKSLLYCHKANTALIDPLYW